MLDVSFDQIIGGVKKKVTHIKNTVVRFTNVLRNIGDVITVEAVEPNTFYGDNVNTFHNNVIQTNVIESTGVFDNVLQANDVDDNKTNDGTIQANVVGPNIDNVTHGNIVNGKTIQANGAGSNKNIDDITRAKAADINDVLDELTQTNAANVNTVPGGIIQGNSIDGRRVFNGLTQANANNRNRNFVNAAQANFVNVNTVPGGVIQGNSIDGRRGFNGLAQANIVNGNRNVGDGAQANFVSVNTIPGGIIQGKFIDGRRVFNGLTQTNGNRNFGNAAQANFVTVNTVPGGVIQGNSIDGHRVFNGLTQADAFDGNRNFANVAQANVAAVNNVFDQNARLASTMDLLSSFPDYPSDGDILMEIVHKNVDLILVTCSDQHLIQNLSGRDRVCCNTASYCFNGLHNGVINVQDSKNDFSLMSACRQVQDELKKDQFCVRKSLSPCQGHGRALLQNRFKNRVDTLYDQFYKHCRRRNTTTVPGVPPAVPATQSPTSNTPGVTTTPVRPPGVPDANGSGHTHGNHSPTSGSGAILAGALTGGIVLALVLFVAVVFWCKNRADRNESGSSDSRGIFFQKRQNMFSTEKPRNNNNNRAVTRQDSCEYAEIDDCMIAPHMPANLVNAGYIHPIGDEEGMIQSVSGHSPHPSRSASVPMVTTRGQLSYGPILAANNNSRSTKPAFYHSTSVASPRELQSMNIGSISETILHPQNLPLSDIAEIREGIGESEFQHSDLEEYEEPVSTNSSLRYTQLDTVDIPPQDLAPDVPQKPSSQPSTPIQGRVRVLPSNPSSPSLRSLSVPNTPPIAKPRRKTASKALKPLASEIKRDSVEAEGKPPVTDTANRDSVMSAKSSHHYFVLEPNENSEYENSISPPKYV